MRLLSDEEIEIAHKKADADFSEYLRTKRKKYRTTSYYICQAQARLTQEDTLKEVGERIRFSLDMHSIDLTELVEDIKRICSDCERGEMPE